MSQVTEMNDAAEIERQLQTLIEQAHDACATSGAVSSECAAAWDAVEEVQAAIADRRSNAKSNFERYCEEHPDAGECRIYDV
jgi:uncharacterized protein YgiB involved in biofilm formation